ncbi:MAG: transposase [Bryobacteraceae bacterium]
MSFFLQENSGAERLQRSLRVHLLSPAAAVQPRGRLSGGKAAARQRPQRRRVVRFYNKRGTAEQWIKEGKQAVKMTRLSCHRFRSNEVRWWLSVIAYNLGNLWRRLVLPSRIGNWSLTSLQQRLVKAGGRLVKHARYYWLLLAESHLTRRLFQAMVWRIAGLPVPTG